MQDSQWRTYSAGHSARIVKADLHISEDLTVYLEQDQHIPFKPATRYPVAGLSRVAPFLFWREGHPSTLSLSFHSADVLSVVTVLKNNKIVQAAHNGPFPYGLTH